ncbi:MAG: 5-deoxy-glucuronate isomerase [Pseudomonadota bacterium]
MSQKDHFTALRQGLSSGYNLLLDRHIDVRTGLDFGIHVLSSGQSFRWRDNETECAFLILHGYGEISADSRSVSFGRTNWIHQKPFVVHGPAGCLFEIKAETDCEIAFVGTANTAHFEPRFFAPPDIHTEHRGKGVLHDTSYRLIRCVFDNDNSPPEVKLVLGEVVNLPGRWSSYPPHHHPQPEIYYYRFSPERGYGHGELGENVFLLRNHDLLRIIDSQDHSQVAAPGYYMYYLWAIRHLETARYTGFEFNPHHKWLLKTEVK